MFGNCCLTSWNYPIQRKIIVVVWRCIPYLITIFWRNQTFDDIFSWSQQHYPHIDPLEHVVLPKHVLHVFVVHLFHPSEWYSPLVERWTFIPNVFHPSCVSGVDYLVEFIQLILETSERYTKAPNLQPLRFSAVEFCMNVDPPGHYCFKSTQ